MGVADALRAHYDARRPGWQLLDVAGRMRERMDYLRTVGREDRSSATRVAAAPAAALCMRPADGRPRVLVCDRYIPTPDRDAGSARMAWILRLIAEMSAHVTFVPQRRFAFAEYAAPLRNAGVEVIAGDARSLHTLMRERHGMYDVVFLSRAEVANHCLAAVRRHQPRARVVFDTVELTSTRLQQQRTVVDGARGNVTRELELEDRAVLLSDVVAAVSDAECVAITRRGFARRTVVLPLVFTARARRAGFDERRDLLFVGNFTHPPNADAVRWFATAVLPQIRQHGDAILRVVGPGATATMVAGWGPHVVYDGWVADLQPRLQRARVAVAPLRYGAGVKGKVGEALAAGLPCVATSVAAEGMDLAGGRHLLIADDPAAFAAAVLRAYTDPAMWTALSNAGIAVVAARWSPQAMTSRLAALLSDTVAVPHHTAPTASNRPSQQLLSRSSPPVQISVT
jgi:glycosyltransferase involved in cell wall biosynthesis